jgi:acyl-CoA synthetase (AMP-forming)/AMP-acid ligase II
MSIFMNNPLSLRIERTLVENADRVLMIDDGVSFTGQAILELSTQIARKVSEGSARRDSVGVLFPNGISQVVSMFGAILADRVPILLSPNTYLKKLDAIPLTQLFTFQEQILNGSARHIVRLNAKGEMASECFRPEGGVAVPEAHSRTGLVLYTSGSSGEAKGVEIPAEGILYLADILGKIFSLDAQTRSPITLPMPHTMCLNTHFFPTFFAGGVCDMVPTSFAMGSLFKHILRSHGSLVAATPEIITFLYEEKKRRNLPAAVLVRHVEMSGGMIHSREIERARELFPNATIHQCYGLTEATRLAMISSDHPEMLPEKKAYAPLPGVSFEARDSEGQRLSPGEYGEIYVKGPTVACAYRGFSAPLCDLDGYLKTGDWGELDAEGRVHLRGRKDGIVKINGKRLSAAEIELTALRLVPKTRAIKFLPTKTKDRERGLLFVETEEDGQIIPPDQIARIQRYIKEEVGIMIKVVHLKEFPRGDNGKVLTKSLLEIFEGASASHAAQAPKTDVGVDFREAML